MSIGFGHHNLRLEGSNTKVSSKFPKSRIASLIIVFTLLFAYHDGFSQIKRRKLKHTSKRIANYKGGATRFASFNYISFGINSMNYFGDLSPTSGAASTDLSFTKPGFTFMWARRFNPWFTLRIGYSMGALKGDDFTSADSNEPTTVSRYVRNLHFRNLIKELSFTGVIDFLHYKGPYQNRVEFAPYIFAGFAILHHNPQARVPEVDVHDGDKPFENAGDWVNLQPLGTEGQYSAKYDLSPYKRIQVAIPFGFGLKYKLNDNTDFVFEFGMRYLFFDFIDDVSGSYPDLGVFSDPLARAMSDRSQEAVSMESGELRDLTTIGSVPGNTSYIGDDGNSYTVIAGYGSDESIYNIRGNASNNDIYIITSLKINYIVEKTFRRAKFR